MVLQCVGVGSKDPLPFSGHSIPMVKRLLAWSVISCSLFMYLASMMFGVSLGVGNRSSIPPFFSLFFVLHDYKGPSVPFLSS